MRFDPDTLIAAAVLGAGIFAVSLYFWLTAFDAMSRI
jgi:hypothetical protein